MGKRAKTASDSWLRDSKTLTRRFGLRISKHCKVSAPLRPSPLGQGCSIWAVQTRRLSGPPKKPCGKAIPKLRPQQA
jgi:hypothetical protein